MNIFPCNILPGLVFPTRNNKYNRSVVTLMFVMMRKKRRLARMVKVRISCEGPLHLNTETTSWSVFAKQCRFPQVSVAVAGDSLSVKFTLRQHHRPRLPAASRTCRWSPQLLELRCRGGLEVYRWCISNISRLPHRTLG